MAFQVEASLLSVRIVLEGWPFGPRLFISFLLEDMAQKYSQEIGNFGSTSPKASIRVISEYHDLRDLCFWGHQKSFGRLEAVASLDAYQITNYQFLSKTHHFCCLISKNSRRSF